ncbi:MAG: bacteriohemerythrin [Desulfobacterales bacterium]|nr:bacteriohemerythrin [Desulfobacterales bacterium]
MEPIEWTDSFSVGVALFDEQHRRLLDMLNTMIKNPTATTRSETIGDVLADMTRYAQEHFKSEEDLMTEHHYPHLEAHKHQHQGFQEKVARLCMATAEGQTTVPRELLAYLQQWLIRHILQADMAFKPFFEQKGVR